MRGVVARACVCVARSPRRARDGTACVSGPNSLRHATSLRGANAKILWAVCAVGAHNDARDARRSAPRDAHALLPSCDGDGSDGANRARPRRVRAPATTLPRRIPRDDEDVPRGGRVRARSQRRRRPRIREEDRGGVVRPGARRPARPVAALGPNEVNELAGTTLLTLSGFEAVLGKVSFGSLLAATSIYEYKVRPRRRHAPIADPRAIARSRRPSPVTPTSPAEDQRPSTRSIHLTLNPTSRPPARLASHPAPLFPTPTTRAGVLHR